MAASIERVAVFDQLSSPRESVKFAVRHTSVSSHRNDGEVEGQASVVSVEGITERRRCSTGITNSQALLWNNERIAAASASVAVQLERQKSAFYPNGASFELAFSGNPGAFEVDIQAADTDQESSYVTINPVTGNLNSSNATRVERPDIYAKFVRFYIKTLTNDVNTTARVTR